MYQYKDNEDDQVNTGDGMSNTSNSEDGKNEEDNEDFKDIHDVQYKH